MRHMCVHFTFVEFMLVANGEKSANGYKTIKPINRYSSCGLLVYLTYGMNSLATLRATSNFVLMHSGIVNGY